MDSDVRVRDDHQAAVVCFDRQIEALYVIRRVADWIKCKVLLVCGVIDILPEHVNLELVAVEHLIPTHEEASRESIPLAEVKAKSEDRWERGVARDVSQKLRHLLR